VDKPRILDGSQVQIGDVVIALASSGVHSNGFSLVRKILEAEGISLKDRLPDLSQSVGDTLLTPTQIYVQPVLALQQAGIDLHGMAHITGGGLPENLPRCLGPGQSVQVQPWEIPPLFDWIAAAGGVAWQEMLRTFNMGIGFALVVSPEQSENAIAQLKRQGSEAWVLGNIVAGDGEVLFS